MDTENYFFLKGDGECAQLVRSFDWGSTPVGSPQNWPKSLRNTVALLLSSEFPMFLWWGNDLIQFYNDAYRPSLGKSGKHPLAMGQCAEHCWPEIWDFIHPLIQQVMTTGKGIWYENLYLPIFRNGQMEDVYWTFSYSAVHGDTGMIEGVLVVCTETTEKVMFLKDLNENKAELEFAIEAAELGTWDFNPFTGKFTSNVRLKEWFGLDPEDEMPINAATDVIAERDRQNVLDAISVALDPVSGGRYEMQYAIVHPKTKVERHVLAKGMAWFDETGNAYRFNGTIQDITSHKIAAQHVTEARQLTDLAVKSVGIGIFKVNFVENTIEYTPEFAAIMTGNKNKKDFTRRSFISHIHPEDEHLRTEAVRAGNDTGEFYYTPRVIWDDGSVHRVAIMGARINDDTGNALAFSGTVRDITLQEAQQLALEEAEFRYSKAILESEALLHSITSSSPTGLWLSDTQGGFTYLNKTLVEWTGMKYEDLLGRGWAKAILEEDRQQSVDALAEAIAQMTHYDVLLRIKKGDNGIIWCRIAGDPYYNDSGDFAGYSGFCMDMDEIIAGRKTIAERESLFRSIVEQAPVATCLFVGREMKVEVANDIMLEYWGKDRSVMGLPLAVAVPELEGQPFLQILDDVFTSGITYQDKAAPVVLAMGGIIGTYYFDFTYKPLRNSDGSIYGVMDMAIDVTQQVLAQQQIDEQQKRLLESFEESPVGIATLDKEGHTFRTVNKFYGELVGRDPKEIINQPLLEAIPELIGQGFDDLLRSVIETGETYTANEVGVNLVRNEVMERIFVDLTYQPRRDTRQQVIGVLVVATDVTQQVLSRHEIEASEKKFRSLISDAPVAMALFRGSDFIIEIANDLILNYLGRDQSIIGKSYREAVPELEVQGFFDLMEQVYTTGLPYEHTDAKAEILKNGVMTTGYFDYTYTPMLDSEMQVYAIILTAIEVTEKVLSRKKLEDVQMALRNAIELAELSTWKFDIKNNVFIYSKRFMDWLGFSEDTKSIDDAYNPLPEGFRESVPAAVKAAIMTGGTGIYDNEHPIINRLTGQVRIIHATAQLYYDSQGNPEFLSGTAQDITKERKLQQELEFLVEKRTEELRTANEELAINNMELQQFAYIASHDLQEPIRKIAVYMQLLEMNMGDANEKSRDYINKINSSTQRMTNLVRDVLGFSQLSGASVDFQTVDLNELIQETINEFELIIEEKNAKITCDKLPVLEAVPLQLSQLFNNLISNALKYVAGNTKPEIEIKSLPVLPEDLLFTGVLQGMQYHKLEFSDNGIGFDQQYAEKIFNIFQRLHGKKEYVGTGIGLAMCKKIAQNHHGTIYAKSTPEKGATFTVLLPRKQVV